MNEKEKALEEFREDLRRMTPDGTINETEKDWDECQKVIGNLLKDMRPCPPEYLDVLNRRWTEMLA